MNTENQETELKLPAGYSVWPDQDGDWWLKGPEDVTLFSEPGEMLLLGACDSEEQAVSDAVVELQALALIPSRGTP